MTYSMLLSEAKLLTIKESYIKSILLFYYKNALEIKAIDHCHETRSTTHHNYYITNNKYDIILKFKYLIDMSIVTVISRQPIFCENIPYVIKKYQFLQV